MLAWLAALQIAVSAVDSAPRPITQLVHTRWTVKEGAPADIQHIAQTPDGYLWLAARSGLVRFDGVRFVPLPVQGSDTIPNGGVQRLLAARDSSLWIVWTSGVVSHWRDGRLRTYGERDGLPPAVGLTESSTRTLVAATKKGVWQFDAGKWNEVGNAAHFPGTECRSIWFDRDDTLWAVAEGRLVSRPAGGQRFVASDLRLTPTTYSSEFAQEKDGTIWMSEVGRSAHTVPRAGDQEPITEVKVGAVNVVVDRSGSVWIGSENDGLRRVINPALIRGTAIPRFGPQAERFTAKDGLLSDFVFALFEDREGDIWAGSSRGLERFRKGAFTPVAMGLSARIRFVAATRDTSVWSGAGTVEIVRLRPGRQDTISSGHLTVDLFADASGVVWSFNRNEILQFNGRRFVPVSLKPKETQQTLEISDVVVDRDGVVWVFEGVSGQLHRLDGHRLVQVAQLPPPARVAGNLLSDRRGRLWIAQRNRIAMYDRGRLQVFGPAEGVGLGLVSHVVEDRAGSIWATTDGGFSRFEGGHFRAILSRQAVPGGAVYDAVEDDAGAWWLLTGNGVLRLPPGEIDRAFADSNHGRQYRTFDGLDGLPGMFGGLAVHGSQITRAADGRIWVATDSGVASIDPRNLPVRPAPPVLIEAIRSDGQEHPPSDIISIPPRTRNLEIDYTATGAATSERVRFRYRLEGADTTWLDVGTRRRAYYSTLAPGSYRFRAIASNGEGVWNETGASLRFRVLPAWYQTLWFRTALVLLTAALGAAAAALIQRRRHVQSQAALKAHFDATLSERARIAQELHDTLLQGFAGVTLQLKAAELALPEEPDVAVETILKVQRLARESLREARERVWDMREPVLGSEDLPAALDGVARERTAGTGIEVSLVSTGRRRRLTGPVEDAAFRIGREAVVNAVRHAEAHRLDIHVEFGPESLRLEVRDDGRGFTPREAEDAHQNGHFGLSGARERAARMGGWCDVRAQPGGGTVVALELPLGEAAAR
jgi:signal transduction histidine kinase/ligand-binding sensor domain-containing protein